MFAQTNTHQKRKPHSVATPKVLGSIPAPVPTWSRNGPGIFVVLLTCVIQMPGICCCRHGWDGERRRPTVRFHQLPLVRCWRGGCRSALGLGGCSQCGLQRSDSIELNPGQAADEARRVVALDEDRVHGSGFCTETQSGALMDRWCETMSRPEERAPKL